MYDFVVRSLDFILSKYDVKPLEISKPKSDITLPI